MKQVALLDVCGVLVQTTQKTLADLGGRLTMADITRWELAEFLTPAENEKRLALWADPSWWESLPLIEGAQEGVELIRRSDYGIVVVTAPWPPCRGWEDARRSLLRAHFGIMAGDVTFTHGKQNVRGDLFIDDRATYIDAWRSSRYLHATDRALVFDAPYNQECLAPRLFGWADLPRHFG